MRPFQNPARAIALPMAMGCIDPSNLLEDGMVFILSDFVEPLPDEVPIHSKAVFQNLIPILYHSCGYRYCISPGGTDREFR